MAEEFSDKLVNIEQKWQEKWSEKDLYKSDPNNEDKFYITVAYPYPSGGMHIGHVRTYTLPDVFARYKRMQGYNVLFPMAWHVTGTPIIGALDRLKEGEEKQLSVLRDTYNVPEDVLESFEEPMDFAEYFIENSYKKNMKKLGFGVDWRREFTTNDKAYNKFVEWQYKRLKDKGLVEKGLHPTKYDIKSENPVTTHDLLEGEDAEKQDYALVKFEHEDGIFPCATLRPETVFGVTHILVKPELDYVYAKVDGEKWIVSEEAAEKLSHQDHEIEEVGREAGKDIVGETVKNPVTDEEVMILPADFIDPDSGTGVVMSVPAHAPYDWISLEDLKANPAKLNEYGLDIDAVKEIEPKQIINVEGYDDIPAKQACEEHGVTSQEDKEELEKATEEVYEKEFHSGELNSQCGEFAGTLVQSAKQQLRNRFEKDGFFDSMWDFSEEVISRSGGKVIISLQESWFLRYNDKGWKDKVHKNLDEANIIPDEKKEDYRHTIDWLEEWPAIRNYGLGTKMPFDKDFIVEPLSDSTIYMAFYTIAHLLEDGDESKLEPEFFDYVFNGEGVLEEVAESLNMKEHKLKECRESFQYWYPLDWRTSAHDLVQNHLTFMMFHHTALFSHDNWPQGIATWGMGTLEGQKMSSSKGHVVLPDEAIQKYGADTTRFFLFASVEPWQDFDWRADEVEKYKKNLRKFYNRSIELYGEGENLRENMLDRYVQSRLQNIIEEATDGLEEFQTRKAGLNAFFEINSLFNEYRNMSSRLNAKVVDYLIETQVKLMSPFTPHTSEEIWHKLGNDSFIVEEDWPETDEELVDREAEAKIEFLKTAVDDIREVSEIVGEFNRVELIVAADWKRRLFDDMNEVIEERPEFGEAMGRLVEGRKEHADKVNNLLQKFFNEPGEMPDRIFSGEEELDVLEENIEFIKNEFDAEVDIVEEENSENEKASRAEPGKPAVVLE